MIINEVYGGDEEKELLKNIQSVNPSFLLEMSAVIHRIDGFSCQRAAELKRVRNHVCAVFAEPAVLFR